jgi:uncharacterized protein (TIGR03067 family)
MRIFALLLLASLTGLAAVGCRKKPDPASDSGTAVSGDQSRLQGVWSIEAVDTGDPKDVPAPEEFQKTRFQFQGNRLNIVDGHRWTRMSFSLQENSDPKVMVMTELNEKGEPERIMVSVNKSRDPEKHEWIYKFEGDLLVIAVTKGEGSRPTEFKARAGSFVVGKEVEAIIIAKLKKTSEAPPTDPGPRPVTTAPFRGTSKN